MLWGIGEQIPKVLCAACSFQLVNAFTLHRGTTWSVKDMQHTCVQLMQ
jgi:hypothetical protein